MNIQFQMGGFLVCFLLFFLYTSRKRLNLYNNNIFYFIMIMTMGLLATDIISVVVIVYQDSLPAVLVRGICKLYLCFLIFEVSSSFAYIVLDFTGEEKHRRMMRAVLLVSILESVLVCLSPIQIYYSDPVAYSYGPATVLTYLFVGCTFLANIIVLIFKRREIYTRRWFAFCVWIASWIAAATVQFMFKEYLLVGYATSLGMVVLYIMLENPELNMNQEFGCFNLFALQNYLKKYYQKNEPFMIYGFSVLDTEKVKSIDLQHLIKEAEQFKHTFVFKELGMDFLFVTADQEDYAAIERWITQTVETGNNIFDNIQILRCEYPHFVSCSKELAGLIQFYRTKLRGNSIDLISDITTDMIEEYLQHDQMIDEINDALLEDRVEVFLQPIYSSKKKRFSSAEALVRIRREDGSLIPPGRFIPVAESSGLIVELGERIFAKTCEYLANYRPWRYGIDYIEVNLSVLQCEEETLAQTLMDIMAQYGVAAERINLEITETATLNAKKKLLKNMDALIDHGCTFSLDDFGKGESNLMYIVEMPVNIVKLDYDMTKAFHKTPKARSVVSSVVNMAHEMGLKVVAEGIETKEELASMIEQEIDYIQGYYFSKPLPMPLFHELIQKQRNVG